MLSEYVDYINDHQKAFDKLSPVLCKDIFINGTGIRILGVHYMDYGSKWVVKRHRHSFYEFHYVLSGNVFTEIDEVRHEIREGGFYLMPPGTYHSHWQTGDQGHLGIALRWEFISHRDIRANNAGDMAFAGYSNFNTPEPRRDDDTIVGDFAGILKMADGKFSYLGLQLEIVHLLLDLLQFYPAKVRNPAVFCQDSETNAHIGMNMKRVVSDAILFIQDNYCNDIDVDDVSNSIHFSYSYLAELFRKETGETITQYINRLRLNKAFKQVQCTNQKISEIAVETGFHSSNYFCTAFRKQFGKSPQEVRAAYQPIPE